MANVSASSIGHRGHVEFATADARQATHTSEVQFHEAARQPTEYAFDLPSHLDSFRAPDRSTSAPPVSEGLDAFESHGDKPPSLPQRAEEIRQLKRQEREKRSSEEAHVPTGPSAYAHAYSLAMGAPATRSTSIVPSSPPHGPLIRGVRKK